MFSPCTDDAHNRLVGAVSVIIIIITIITTLFKEDGT